MVTGPETGRRSGTPRWRPGAGADILFRLAYIASRAGARLSRA
jgi:hypothetical protein